MNVLLLSPGTSIHTVRMVRMFLKKGCKVCVADESNPFPDGTANYEFFMIKRDESAVATLKNIKDFFKPDVTYVCWVDVRVWFCVQAGLKPLVLSPWGSDINQHFLPGANKEHAKKVGELLKMADKIVVGCEYLASCCSQLAEKKLDISVLNLGIDTDLFLKVSASEAAALREKLAIPPNVVAFLSGRAWAPHYNHHLALAAFARVLPLFDVKPVIIFVLYNPSYKNSSQYLEEMRKISITTGLEKYIRWLDAIPHNELPALYSAMDVFLNLPVMDSLAITLQEVAASMRPFITFDLPAYRGTFVEKYGRVVSYQNLDELVKAMSEFKDVKTNISIKQNCKKAQEAVITTFDERFYVEGMMNIFSSLS